MGWPTCACGVGVGWMGLFASGCGESSHPGEGQLNRGRGVNMLSNHAEDAYMMALWICVGIGVVVCAAMAYAIFAFRKSKGAGAATFTHNTTAEVIWPVIPVLLLIGMSWPATRSEEARVGKERLITGSTRRSPSH